MAALRNKIERIRFSFLNTEDRRFIPEIVLYDVIAKPVVKESLRGLKVPIHEINDITNDILRGARKCFAILLVIDQGKFISNFIRHDSLQESTPDNRLPYNSEQLQQIFREEDQEEWDKELAIQKFLEKQWEFVIPIMQRHTVFRELHTSVILPFRRREHIGQGAMGDAWKVEIYPECHQLPLQDHTVIRKEFIYKGRDGKGAFEKELENLALLTNLKHKNIVELYCAYKYREAYNLVFAFAGGGSLEDLLTGKSLEGPNDSQLLLAVAELASAIDAFHNFTSEALDLKLSGCHHDLAPRNILIHDQTFILADFGLSSLRNAKEDSLTLFKDVRGSFLAPECQPMQDGNFITGQISRASDIWSFGCILSEILTYMKAGSDGVQQFRDQREVEVTPDLTWPRFHRGPGRSSPFVESWLNKLQANAESHFVRMVDLIRKMLSMDPKERPRSADVLTALRGIWVISFGDSIQLLLNDMCKTHSAIDCILNRIRFRSWLIAFHHLLDDENHEELGGSSFDFPEIVHALKETHRILESSAEVTATIQHQKQSLLRYQHVKLAKALPLSYRRMAKDHLESLLLEGDNAEQLGDLSTAIREKGDEDIGVLIAVKHFTVLANTDRLTDQGDLVLEQSNVTLQEDIEIHSLALLEPTSEPVLVEWLKYKVSWADKVTGPELRRRLESVIGLLHAESIARIPGSLHCKGMFHDPSRRSFGVVYDLLPSGGKPVTLHQLLNAPKSPYRPLLEYRFQLAFDICQCIYTFHKVGWLHRNLHSMNILFFPPRNAEKTEWAKEPRIVGFSRSRESTLDSFTYGPEDNSQLRNYQHPEYTARQKRYCEEFDYYSVGMLLLEIGLWSTLSKVTDSENFQGISDNEYKAKVLERRVPQLGIAMGTHYMQATRACLLGDCSGDAGKGDYAWHMWFKDNVIDQIRLVHRGMSSARPTNTL